MAKRENTEDTAGDETATQQGQQQIRLIQRCIEQHLADESLEQHLASLLSMAREDLSALIEQTFGRTLGEYILQERMRMAQRMLLESTGSISAIGQAIGYPNVSTFSSVFRKWTGMTPGTFRKTATLEKLTSAGGMQRWG